MAQIDRRLASLVLLAGCVAAPAPEPEIARAPQEERLTIERIFGEPDLTGTSARGFVWLPDGSGFVQVERASPSPDERDARASLVRVDAATGASSTWVAADAFWKAFSEGGGRHRPSGRPGLDDFTILADGRHLLLESADDLWIYDVEAAAARQLTSTPEVERGAMPSPDGTRVAFVRGFDVWSVDVATGAQRPLTSGGTEEVTHGLSDWVYDEELGVSGGIWWSPDGSRIAILEMDERPVPKVPIVDFLPLHPTVEWERYPKAGDPNPIVRVGVVDASGGSPTWLDLPGAADGYVARVNWSADSRSLFVQVLDRAQKTLTILRVDPVTGTSAPFLVESSAAWVDVHDDLRILADGRLLWRSSRSGFAHLELVSKDGTERTPLPSGSWNVARVAGLDEEGGWVYFVADAESPRESHGYRVRLDGSGLERITPDRGSHGLSMAPGARAFVDSWSAIDTPRRRDLRRADGSLVARLRADTCPQLDACRRAVTEFVQIPTADGVVLQGAWIRPRDFDPARRYPVVMEVYGGPLASIVRDAWPSRARLWDEMLADRGLIVFLLDNRASASHGMAGAAAIRGRLGEVELGDELEAVRWLRTQPWVDPDRLAIWGWSYGGYMAAYSILNAPDAFRAAVAVAPVTDWRDYDTIYTERYMGLPQENRDGYERSSPVHAAANLRGQLLLVHGTSDDNVHLQNTMQLAEALEHAGKPFRLMVYPGRRHGIGGLAEHRHVFGTITDFLFESLDVK